MPSRPGITITPSLPIFTLTTLPIPIRRKTMNQKKKTTIQASTIAMIALVFLNSCSSLKILKDDDEDLKPKRIIYTNGEDTLQNLNKETYTQWMKSNLEDEPVLSESRIEKIYVPDQIVGNRYITSHFIYIIKKNPSWRKELNH